MIVSAHLPHMLTVKSNWRSVGTAMHLDAVRRTRPHMRAIFTVFWPFLASLGNAAHAEGVFFKASPHTCIQQDAGACLLKLTLQFDADSDGERCVWLHSQFVENGLTQAGEQHIVDANSSPPQPLHCFSHAQWQHTLTVQLSGDVDIQVRSSDNQFVAKYRLRVMRYEPDKQAVRRGLSWDLL